MLHGKKGFDRLLYACKNVFAAPLTWLYTTYPNGKHAITFFLHLYISRPPC